MEQEFGGIAVHFFSTLAHMIWQIYWPLAFGLTLSSWIRNIVPVSSVVSHLGKTTVTSVALTTFLGMISSSCSYAAASLSHTLLVKKSTLANAMAFLVSSTNLILEMFIVLVALMGWTFLWGEIVGGLILITMISLLFKFCYPKDVEQELRQHMAQSEGEAPSKMSNTKPANAASTSMDMSKMKEGGCGADMLMEESSGFMAKVSKSAGFFHMDITMIGKEILIGVVISSFLIAFVPQDAWRNLFISNGVDMPGWIHSTLDVLIGIFVAVIAYVCSVGNLLLAAALWHGGISFGGVIGFILADVLTIPMIMVYKNYYGLRPALWMASLLFIGIFFTGLSVDAIFNSFGWITTDGSERTLIDSSFKWNLTTVMNLIFIPLSIWYYYVGKKANAGMTMKM